MIAALIIVSSIVAILSDYYIWRRVNKRHKFGRLWECGYLIYAFIVDTAVVTALLMYSGVEDGMHAGVWLRAAMWAIAIFFLHAIPKVVYVVVSLGDYIVQHLKKDYVSHWFGIAGIFLGFAAFVMILHGMTWGRSQIKIKEVELTFADLPESFDGLRVAQFSDLHMGTLINRDKFLERVVRSINSLNPDIVINSGDIVNTHAWELDYEAMGILGGIESRYGVYAAPGNHDKGIYINDTVAYSPAESVTELTRRQTTMGWVELADSSVFINNGADSITISGVNYPPGFRRRNHSKKIKGANIRETYDNIPDSLFNITISHAPQLWDEVRETGYADLTVAGHVHSFQVKFHFGKYKWSPAAVVYDRWSGLYEEEGKYLYINDGLGNIMFPMRVGVKPEITLFILRSPKND